MNRGHLPGVATTAAPCRTPVEFTQQEKPAETKVDANLEPTAKITPEKSSDVREIAARIIYIMIFFWVV